MQTIFPCPECRSIDVFLNPTKKKWKVSCDSCGYQGPVFASRIKAVDGWNDRVMMSAEEQPVDLGEALEESLSREKKLEARVKELVDALEATVESLETNGFGKQYAIDVGKAALAKARGEENKNG